MDTLLIVFISILGVVVLALFGILVWLARGIYKRDLELQELRKERKFAGEIENIAAAKEAEYKVWEAKIQGQVEIYNKRNEMISNQGQQLETLNNQLMKTTQDLEGYAAKLKEEYDKILEVQGQKLGLENDISGLRNTIEELKREANGAALQLSDLQERHKLAIVREQVDGELWDMILDGRDKKLIEVLREIENDYPEFLSDLATIEWKSIWLPKLQDLVSEHNLSSESGIYMLVLKNDETIRYVGQAVDIKARWYDHVKKMVGIMGKGAEKLYRYRPEDFYWTVVERKPKNLNEAENYWIEFYGCREKGLNKK